MYIEDLLNKADTTDSYELNNIGTDLLGESFIGVFSADNIPSLDFNGDCLIFNNQNSNQNGEHWLGLYNECDRVYAFDTYGRDIKSLNPHFKNKKWIVPKHRRLESLYGEDCGQLVLAWLCTVRTFGIENFFSAFNYI